MSSVRLVRVMGSPPAVFATETLKVTSAPGSSTLGVAASLVTSIAGAGFWLVNVQVTFSSSSMWTEAVAVSTDQVLSSSSHTMEASVHNGGSVSVDVLGWLK